MLLPQQMKEIPCEPKNRFLFHREDYTNKFLPTVEITHPAPECSIWRTLRFLVEHTRLNQNGTLDPVHQKNLAEFPITPFCWKTSSQCSLSTSFHFSITISTASSVIAAPQRGQKLSKTNSSLQSRTVSSLHREHL